MDAAPAQCSGSWLGCVSLCLYLIGLLRPNVVTADSFVVEGSVVHEQYGPHPTSSEAEFVARSAGAGWLISARPGPGSPFDEVLAVGGIDGTFIAMDFSSLLKREAVAAGRTRGPNTAQALVSNDPVPNCSHAPYLSTIWLTYLSAHHFQTMTADRMAPPMPENVAGGSPLPAFSSYQQPAHWRLSNDTGLPVTFVSMDESGQIMGIISDKLVPVQRQPPPYDKGFTNIVFEVQEFQVFDGRQLPKVAELLVYWISDGRREKIHRIAIRARRISHAPAAPIPAPTPLGIAIVADGRTSTGGVAVVVEYAATNRFLEPKELSRLPQFADAVSSAMHRSRSNPILVATANLRRTIVVIGLLLISLVAIAVLLRRAKPKHHHERRSNDEDPLR